MIAGSVYFRVCEDFCLRTDCLDSGRGLKSQDIHVLAHPAKCYIHNGVLYYRPTTLLTLQLRFLIVCHHTRLHNRHYLYSF